jgi:hypothetical protein
MHRIVKILGATTLIGVVAACGPQPTRQENAAAPAGVTSPTATPADAPATTPTPPAPSSTPQATPPAETPVKTVHTDPADLTIRPNRIGVLTIGMSLKAAKATGLIVIEPGQADQSPDSCTSAHWKDQPGHVWMIFNGRYGLRAIQALGHQKTPEGIKPGSTLAAVRRAYPHLTWRETGDDIADAQRTAGDALIDAVKGDGAHYRINIQKSKVADIELESDRPGCYE